MAVWQRIQYVYVPGINGVLVKYHNELESYSLHSVVIIVVIIAISLFIIVLLLFVFVLLITLLVMFLDIFIPTVVVIR
jgi:hypothetical protein